MERIYNVLIADDEEKIIWFLREIIDWEEIGLKLAGTASDGKEACEQICQNDIDIVITDIKMPLFDGLQMIERVRQERKNVSFIVISGYDHFQYAQLALRYGVKDYILKPVKKTELNNALYKIVQEKNHKQFSWKVKTEQDNLQSEKRKDFLAYLQNEQYILPELSEANRKFSFEFQDTSFLWLRLRLNLQLDYLEDTLGTDFIMEKLQKIIAEKIQGYVGEYETISRNTDIYVLLNGFQIGQISLEHVLLRHVRAYLDAFRCYSVSMYCGEEVPYSELIPAMKRAKTACEEQMALGAEHVIRDDMLASLETDPEQTAGHEKNIKDIRNGFTLLDEAQVMGALHKMMERIQKFQGVSSRAVIRAVSEIQAAVLELSGEEAPDNREIQENQRLIGAAAENAVSVTDFLRYSEEKMGETVGILFRLRKERESRPINRAKEYVEQHLSGKLNLEEVAEYLELSPNYFSSLFKRETGKTYLDYVTERKMEYAKKLLKNSSDTVEAIAMKVGYRDKRSFSSRFEAVVGLKPSKYRKMYR